MDSHRSPFARTLLTAALALGLFVAPAQAANGWKPFTEPTNTNLTQVSVARLGAGGPLLVSWAGPTAAKPHGNGAVRVRTVMPNGSLGAVQEVQPAGYDWDTTNPALARNPVTGALSLFFSDASQGPSGTSGALHRLDSADAGLTWAPHFGLSEDRYAYSQDLGAAFSPAGTAYEIWGATVQEGLGDTHADDNLKTDPGVNLHLGDFEYNPNVAVDSVTGQVVFGWYSNATNASGIEAWTYRPTPAAAPTYMPGSADASRNSALGGLDRTAMSSRLGAPGVFVAYGFGYPSTAGVRVYRVGGTVKTVAKFRPYGQDPDVSIAPGPDGRLWVFWDDQRRGCIAATRSNTAATVWGAVGCVGLPAKGASIYHLAGDGSLGALDVFAHDGSVTWYRRILPRLTLTGPAKAKHAVKVTFHVLDAGVPVKGAKVAFGGHSATTDAKGAVTLTSPATKRSAAAAATASSYSAGSLVVRLHG